jgi:hypothetical protein
MITKKLTDLLADELSDEEEFSNEDKVRDFIPIGSMLINSFQFQSLLKLHLRNQVVSIRGVLRTYFHIFIWI